MKNPIRARVLNMGLLALVAAGFSIGQEQAPPARVVLTKGQVRYVAPAAAAALVNSPRAALTEYAGHFGIQDPAGELRQFRTTPLAGAGVARRYRQLHQGYPVIGGELVLTMDANGGAKSLTGETTRNLKLASAEPAITAAQARATALAAMTKYHPDQAGRLAASTPELWVYDPALIGPDTQRGARLVWRMEVTAEEVTADVRELVLVDAADGSLALHFNQIATALSQATYTANGSNASPGILLCDETQPDCTHGANPDADFAHRHGRDTYNFYFDHHGRDSFDGLGATLVSTVQYSAINFCPNASWTGTLMRYCAGAPAADDVVAHELTHAVTQHTSGLLYFYQSGAINESFSDIWGEFVDLTNSSGTDTPAVRWLMGEDFPALGIVRNLADPPAYGDPDRMRSPRYHTNASDNYGVHVNSGVNNKAATLMVDGGSFNGFTMTGIGIDKTAALYYRAQTQHLTSGSDYADLYLALTRGCQDMIGGPEGMQAMDCQQVANALDAVEMNLPPLVDAGSEAPVCSANQVPTDTYYDSFEDNQALARWPGSWLYGSQGTGTWLLVTLGTDGAISLFTRGRSGISDYVATMAQPVVVPANAFLHFRHLIDQEQSEGRNWDGGLVEYSVDGGTTWLDAAALYSSGLNYNGLLDNTTGNPAGGRNAFVGNSRGYVSTRYDLATLAGQNLLIRFRNTSDESVTTSLAWAIDEVRVYTCGPNGMANQSPVANGGADMTVAPLVPVMLNGSGSFDPDGYLASAEWTQIGGTVINASQTGRTLSFTSPATAVQEQLVFRLTVTDERGAIATDDVTVTVVNQQPVANAGADQSTKPRRTVVLIGSATDADGTVASYSWTQTGGPPAGLEKLFTRSTSLSTNGISFDTGVLEPGSGLLFLNFPPAAGLTNTGGTVQLAPGSEIAICEVVVAGVCTQRAGVPLTGAISAPVVAATTGPITWTLQSVKTAGGAAVTGRFSFASGQPVPSNVLILAAQPATRSLGFPAPSVPATATLDFRLTSIDNAGGTGSDDVSVTVTNDAPVAYAGVDQAVKAGADVALSGNGTDSEGPISAYRWTQTGGPPVSIQNAGKAAAKFKAPKRKEPSTLTLRLTVTDNDGSTAYDDVTVNVAAKKSGGGSLDLWLLLALCAMLAMRMLRLRDRG